MRGAVEKHSYPEGHHGLRRCAPFASLRPTKK
jgi:hypothetical protein